MGFAKEDSFTSGALNPDAFKELLTLSPQQVLPFHMHMADGPTRHLIVPHLQGPVKALVMLVQVLQLAVERFSHFKPAALHDQMEQVCRPKQAPLDHAKQADRQEGTGSAQHTYEEAAAVAGADPAEEAAAVQGSPDDGHNTESSEAVHADQEACQTASAEVHLNDAAGKNAPWTKTDLLLLLKQQYNG